MAERKTIRILLIEDNRADVELIRLRLESNGAHQSGFQLSIAESLAAANSQLLAGSFDIVLLDLGLPDSAGMGTLRRFFSDQTGLPVIVLTGLNDEDMAIQAVNSGAQDFLVKDELDARLLRRSIRYSMERHRMEREQRRLSAQLLNVIGDEQQRIARELHDEVGQGLAGLNMMSRSLARNLRHLSHPEARKSQMISEGIQDVLDSFRRVLCGLSPVDLDEQGLPVALRRLCETIQQTGVDCTLVCEPDLSIEDNSIATHLYRIAQESLTNAMRHAGASQLRVKLAREGSKVLLSVSDDGDGFEPSDRTECGMGLRILRHRSELIGGSLSIKSGVSGTTVQCEVGLHGAKTNS